MLRITYPQPLTLQSAETYFFCGSLRVFEIDCRSICLRPAGTASAGQIPAPRIPRRLATVPNYLRDLIGRLSTSPEAACLGRSPSTGQRRLAALAKRHPRPHPFDRNAMNYSDTQHADSERHSLTSDFVRNRLSRRARPSIGALPGPSNPIIASKTATRPGLRGTTQPQQTQRGWRS
jgi:hypothetical protein